MKRRFLSQGMSGRHVWMSAGLLTVMFSLTVTETQAQRRNRSDDADEKIPRAQAVDSDEAPKPKRPKRRRPVQKPKNENAQERTQPPVAPPADDVIPEAKPVSEAEQKLQKQKSLQLAGSSRTQADARTLFLKLPAPRGQIVDRDGTPLAQNIVGFYPAITFPEGAPMSDAAVIAYTRQRMELATKVWALNWSAEDKDILAHYKNRRQMPFLCGDVRKDLDENEGKKSPMPGLGMHPAYVRTYPQERLACHILGHVGKSRGMATGPVAPEDTYYPEPVGRDGLEQQFDTQLSGKPGTINILFDTAGKKLNEEITDYPVPGHTIVTTIDSDFQRIAEDVLRSRVSRGAFVIVDVYDGDVVALASWPNYNPNDWVPSISQKDFTKLTSDEDKPLLGRAFMGQYPPASTFKIFTALAGLDSGKITPNTIYNCTPSMKIGSRVFHNWNRKPEGPMDLNTAIKRSCNPYFYRTGLATGSANLVSMAHRFGFGDKTGIQLRAESPGLMPTDEWMVKSEGRELAAGDVANISIGQGNVLATPLQVARAMAGVANGEYLPDLRLVKQIQDISGNVVEVFPPSKHNELNLRPDYIRAVQGGMRAVVDSGSGTGKDAANGYVSVAGKTGTAQWGKNRHMAWFAGFLPAKNPQYAYAAIYEGDPGESSISGGKKAAPMVRDVFNRVYRLKKERGESMSGRANATLTKKKDGDGNLTADGEEKTEEKKPRRRISKRRTESSAETASSNSRNRAEMNVPRERESSEGSKPKPSGVRGFFRKIFKGE